AVAMDDANGLSLKVQRDELGRVRQVEERAMVAVPAGTKNLPELWPTNQNECSAPASCVRRSILTSVSTYAWDGDRVVSIVEKTAAGSTVRSLFYDELGHYLGAKELAPGQHEPVWVERLTREPASGGRERLSWAVK